jgi:hypothetical protein
MREMALFFGVTERRIARILKDLSDAQMIEVHKNKKRNSYSVVEDASGLHPLFPEAKLGDIVEAVLKDGPKPEPPARRLLDLTHGLMLPIGLSDSEAALGLLPLLG